MSASRQSKDVSAATALVLPLDFDGIYRSEVGFIWGFLRKLGIAERDVEDVAHEVFMVVYRKLAQFDSTRPLRPWVVGITLRVASDQRRRAWRRRERIEDPHTLNPPVESQAEAKVEAMRQSTLVRAALDKLPPEQRAALVLHDVEGYTMTEIAQMSSTPMNTLYTRLRRGRGLFTRTLRKLQQNASRP